jgi:hypothetical protein
LAWAGPSSDWGGVDSIVMRALPGTLLSGAFCVFESANSYMGRC